MKTIRVKIPAVIAPDGRWAAYGYQEAMQDPDWAMVEEVADGEGIYTTNYKRVWITAELPVPEEETIAALEVGE